MCDSYEDWLAHWLLRLEALAPRLVRIPSRNPRISIHDCEDIIHSFLLKRGPALYAAVREGKPDAYAIVAFRNYVKDLAEEARRRGSPAPLSEAERCVTMDERRTESILEAVKERSKQVAPLITLPAPDSGLDHVAAVLLRERVVLARQTAASGAALDALEVALQVWPWDDLTRARRVGADYRSIGEAWDALAPRIQNDAEVTSKEMAEALGCRSPNQFHQWCSRGEKRIVETLGADAAEIILPGIRRRRNRGDKR